MPAPNAKCLGVLLWGPAEAVIQGGSVAGPRGWFRCCQERGFSDGEGSRGGGRVEGPDRLLLSGGHGVHRFPGAGSLCATPVSQGGKEPAGVA